MINEQDSDNSSDLSEEEETVFKAENHRSRSEYMTMKQVNNFKQENLETHSIMMLDFESEVYIWVGSKCEEKRLQDYWSFAQDYVKKLQKYVKVLKSRRKICSEPIL